MMDEEIIFVNLKSIRRDVRRNAALQLAFSKLPLAAGYLIKTVENDPDRIVRICACASLGQLQDPTAIPILIKIVKNQKEYPSVRAEAAEALHWFDRNEPQIQCLKEGLFDKSPQVRFFCVYSLGELNEISVFPILKSIAVFDRSIVRGFGPVRNEAKRVLKKWMEKDPKLAIKFGDNKNH